MAVSIEFNKNKTNVLLPGFVITALASLLVLLSACGVFTVTARIPAVALVLVSIMFLSSVYFIYLAVKALRNKLPALTVDSEGFLYRGTSLGKAIGYIKWCDVKELKDIDGHGNRYLAVMLHNPQDYINRMKPDFTRKQAEKHLRKHPKNALLTVSAYGLDCKFEELKRLMYNAYKPLP